MSPTAAARAAARQAPLRPDPKLTHRLRVTVAVCAEVMHAEEKVFTAALTDSEVRRALRQMVDDLANLVEAVRRGEATHAR